jgi:hypothetical protein
MVSSLLVLSTRDVREGQVISVLKTVQFSGRLSDGSQADEHTPRLALMLTFGIVKVILAHLLPKALDQRIHHRLNRDHVGECHFDARLSRNAVQRWQRCTCKSKVFSLNLSGAKAFTLCKETPALASQAQVFSVMT